MTLVKSLLAPFIDVDALPIVVSKRPLTKTLTEKLFISTDLDLLSPLEEKRIKDVVFPEELKFSVPVNLYDSKKAYLTLLSDKQETEDEVDFFRAWGLDELSADSTSTE